MGLERYLLFIGSILSLITLGLIYWLNAANLLVIIAFIVGMALIIGSLSKFAQCTTIEDERTRKIAAFSMMNSGITTMVLLTGLLALIFLGSLNNRSAIQIVSLPLLIMVFVFLCGYTYYSIKGDVE